MHRLNTLLAVGALCVLPAHSQAPAVSDGVVRIGVLTDMSSVYADSTGRGSVFAVRAAVEDIGAKVLGVPVEVVFADHQNKADVAATKAREWFDRDRVDVVVDLVNSAAALAVMRVAKEKNRIALVVSGASARITNEDCNDVTVHWSYDSWATSNAIARTLLKQGLDSWYFVTADYVLGHTLERDATGIVKELGGKVAGSTKHSFPAADMASPLLAAQSSGAKVVAFANAGADLHQSVKQSAQFGITGKQALAALLMVVNDVHAVGLQDAQGMYFVESFYWDTNERTRKFAQRFFGAMKQMPNMGHAGNYSAINHYLKAVAAAKTDEAQAVMAAMRAMPVNDFSVSNGTIRQDGRLVRDMYILQVKSPAESKSPWDYAKLTATIPGKDAFAPLSASRCPLVKK